MLIIYTSGYYETLMLVLWIHFSLKKKLLFYSITKWVFYWWQSLNWNNINIIVPVCSSTIESSWILSNSSFSSFIWKCPFKKKTTFIVIFSVPFEKIVINKERAAGWYRLSAYFLAKCTSELPLILIQPFFFVTVAYWCIGLNGFVAFLASIGTIFITALTGQVTFFWYCHCNCHL